MDFNEIAKLVNKHNNPPEELTMPEQIVFNGLKRINWCSSHRILTEKQIKQEMVFLKNSFKTINFDYNLWQTSEIGRAHV